MRTRTRILIFGGLLAIAVGVVVVVVGSWLAPPRVILSFVRYTNYGIAILGATNRAQSPLLCSGMNVEIADASDGRWIHEAERWPFWPDGLAVLPRGRGELMARPRNPPTAPLLRLPELPTTVSVFCHPQIAPKWMRIVQVLLNSVGINVNTGFVVSVTLPPREAPASPTNTPPASLTR